MLAVAVLQVEEHLGWTLSAVGEKENQSRDAQYGSRTSL